VLDTQARVAFNNNTTNNKNAVYEEYMSFMNNILKALIFKLVILTIWQSVSM